MLGASQLPAQISVIHCRAHSGQNDISMDNDPIERSAKVILKIRPTQLRSPNAIRNIHSLKTDMFSKRKWMNGLRNELKRNSTLLWEFLNNKIPISGSSYALLLLLCHQQNQLNETVILKALDSHYTCQKKKKKRRTYSKHIKRCTICQQNSL